MGEAINPTESVARLGLAMVETERKKRSRITRSEWRTIRMRVLLGQTWDEIATDMGRDEGHLRALAQQRGLAGEGGPGELSGLAAEFARERGIIALVSGDQAGAAQALRIAALLERGPANARGETSMMSQFGDHRRKHVDQMSEAELRDELARLLGVEIKTSEPVRRRQPDSGSGETTGAASVPDDAAGGAGPAGG